jgi:hypothetical protein
MLAAGFELHCDRAFPTRNTTGLRVGQGGTGAAGFSNYTEQPEYEHDHYDASNRNRKIHKDLFRPSHPKVLGWSSEEWSKARKSTTVGWIKIGLDSYVDPDVSILPCISFIAPL